MWLWLFLLAGIMTISSPAEVLVGRDSSWHYFKGISEASSPDPSSWRTMDFSDGTWALGTAAFFYERDPASGTAYTGNTSLPDMYGGYSCLFLRSQFVISNPDDIGTLQIAGLSDDGFIAWINGVEVGRFNMPAGNIPFDGTASGALAEPIPWWTNTIPNPGSLLVPGTNILALQAFNSSVIGSSDFVINPALYYTPNTNRPFVTYTYPVSNAIVRPFSTLEVGFNTPVSGVDASDLRLNGQPATSVTVLSPSQFTFGFPATSTGVVQITWAPTHGIRDVTARSNSFSGQGWTYTCSSNAPMPLVMISEFMAANSGSLPGSVIDNLGSTPDWIEIYNGHTTPVSLTGWALTDDATKLGKWKFPTTQLPAKSYLVIYASGRDTNSAGQLHTNFKLGSGSGFLGLVDTGGVVVSAFSPTYPGQFTDVSYGRDRLDPSLTGYFTNSTPGAANSTRGTGFGPEVQFSLAGGVFTNDIWLTLTTSDSSDIRYVIVTSNVPSGSLAITNIPLATSPLYTTPLLLNNTAQVRARAFPKSSSQWPGPPRTENYVRITTTATAFASDLPIFLLHNLAGGSVPQETSQSAIFMVFEPVNGWASFTNPPTLVSRAGFNIRGSSTAGLPQASFALELWDEYNDDHQQELLGMPSESDWVLFAEDGFDTSFLHNPLMHQLSRNIGRYSSRTRFAELFLNTGGGTLSFIPSYGGNYNGLYTIEEKVKRGPNRVDIAKLEPWHTNATDVTGGYLLKNDRADSNERTFYDAAMQGGIVYVDPPGLEMETAQRTLQAQYIQGYFASFGTALWGPNYTNPVSGYAPYIDQPAWIDHHILNVFSYNVDGIRLSAYFFKDRGGRIAMGPLWDFDRSLGTSYSGDTRCFNPRVWRVQAGGDQGTDFFGNPALLGVRWWSRLFTAPDFWQAWIDRWTELRRGPFSTNTVFTTIDALSSQLRLGQAREKARWSYTSPRSGITSANGYTWNFSGTYQGEINFLKQWISDRVNFIDTNFLKAPNISATNGPLPTGSTVTLSTPSPLAGTITYYTLNGLDPRLPGGSLAPYALSNSGTTSLTITQNVRLFARNFNPAHRNLTGGAVGGNPPISSSWSGATTATLITTKPSLIVTEIMYHPPAGGSYADEDYEFIEMRNAGPASIPLTGLHFTNGIDYTFSSTNTITQLAPGQYMLLVRNRAAFLSRYPGVTNIIGEYSLNLANSGEHIYLEGSLKEPILDFSFDGGLIPTADGLGFSLVLRDEGSPGQDLSSSSSWRASTRLQGSPGGPDPLAISIPGVLINEILPHTDLPQVDSVELFNPGPGVADIGGWFLSDNPGQPRKYKIPSGRQISPGGFMVFTTADFGSGTMGSFALSSLGDQIYIFSGDGTNITGYRHGFDYGPQFNGVTLARHVSSDGLEHFVIPRSNTLGATNASPRVGPIVFSEIMYAPRPLGSNANTLEEYVEISNLSGDTVPLYDPLHTTNTWKIQGGISFTFAPETELAPFSRMLLVSFDPTFDPVARNWFLSRYSLAQKTVLFGPFSGKLSNQSDTLRLLAPDKPELADSPVPGFVPYVSIEEVHYSSLRPWPESAVESGLSIGRMSPWSYADDPSNWVAGQPSPTAMNQGAVIPDFDQDGLPDEWEKANGLDMTDPTGTQGSAADPDGDGYSNLQEYIAGTNPLSAGDYPHFNSARIVGTQFLLTFDSRVGRTYSIERKNLTNSGASPWTNIVINIAGDGTTKTITDAIDAGLARCYRLKTSVAP